MSAKRGSTEERYAKSSDFYETPAWATQAILPFAIVPEGGVLLDPFAGRGAILREAEAWSPSMRCIGYELRQDLVDTAYASPVNEGRLAIEQRDSLTTRWEDVDVIMTNPPFARAIECVEMSIDQARRRWDEGRPTPVFHLLRLSFLEGKARAAFHRANPSRVRVLPRRPSFTGDGKSDACAYAWFQWSPEITHGEWMILDLPSAPADVEMWL